MTKKRLRPHKKRAMARRMTGTKKPRHKEIELK